MADVRFIPCGFKNLLGTCKTPSDNGFCTKHEKLKCVSCGVQATTLCEWGHISDGPSGCDNLCKQPICDNCVHDPSQDQKENCHITREEYRKK